MSPVLDELRAYGDFLDEVQGEVDISAIVGGPEVVVMPSRSPLITPRRLALAAVAIAIAGIAASLLLDRGDESPPAVDIVTATTTSEPLPDEDAIGPETWDVAAFIPDGSFTDIAFSGTVADLVTEVAGWPGVVEVISIEATPAAWTAAVGAYSSCGPESDACQPGVAVRTEDDAAAEAVGAALAERLDGESVSVTPTLAAGRITAYVDSVIGRPAPAPAFDTDELGIEQVLGPLDPEIAAEYLFELPFDGTQWPYRAYGVAVAGVDTRAVMLVPDLDRIDLSAVRLFSSAPDEAKLDLHLRAGIDLGTFPLSEGSALPAQPLTPSGTGYPLGSVASWEGQGEGAGRTFQGVSLGGLPEQVAAVSTVLGDGTRVWQRPYSGIVVFGGDLAAGAPSPRLFAYDADGNALFEYWNHQIQEPGATQKAIESPGDEPPTSILHVGDVVQSGTVLTDGAHVWSVTPPGTITRSRLLGPGETVTASVPDAVGFLLHDDSIWAAGGGTASELDLRTMTIVRTIPFPFDLGRYDLRSGNWVPVIADGGIWFDANGAIVRVDLETGDITDRVEVSSSLHGFATDDAFFSLGTNDLLRVDLATGATSTNPLEDPITRISRAIEIDGEVWVTYNDPSFSVAPIDLESGDVGPRIELGESLHRNDTVSLTAGAGGLWVWVDDSPVAARIDLTTRDLTPVTAGRVRIFGDQVWVAGPQDGTLSQLAPTGAVIETVEIAEEYLYAWFPFEGVIYFITLEGDVTAVRPGHQD